jgi:hypothetical protein
MKDPVESDEDFSFYNINSILYFVKNNVIQIFLFLLVFVIIYIVDHISNINTMLLAMQQQQQQLAHKKITKKSKSKK